MENVLFVDKYSDNIYCYLNRDKLSITFVRVRDNLVFMTDYLSLGVTGSNDNIIAIDPTGGPIISVGAILVFGCKIPFLTGQEVIKITLSQYGVYIHLHKPKS